MFEGLFKWSDFWKNKRNIIINQCIYKYKNIGNKNNYCFYISSVA